MDARKLEINEREQKMFGVWVPIKFCSSAGCKNPAEFIITGKNPAALYCKNCFKRIEHQVILRDERSLPSLPIESKIPQTGSGKKSWAQFGTKKPKKYIEPEDRPEHFLVCQALFCAWNWPDTQGTFWHNGIKYLQKTEISFGTFVFTETGCPIGKIGENGRVEIFYDWIRDTINSYAPKYYPEHFQVPD